MAGATICGLVAALGVVAISPSATARGTASRAGRPHLTERQILRIALRAARSAGDREPRLIQHREGTRERANLVDAGDVVPGHRWSYLIAERGRFVFNRAPTPLGAHAPTGSVLTLIVDAATRQVTDSGLSNRYPDLSRLGPVSTDLRRVAVPGVIGLDLNRAYAHLHRAGLRVSFPHSFSAGSFACAPIIAKENPAARALVAAGSTVTLTARPPSCGVASPGVPVGRLPSAKVRDFIGGPLSAAMSWAKKHQLYWEADKVPRLVRADAKTLLGNYRVTGQRPRPGATLTLGVATRHGNGGSFRPTPLILRAAALRSN